MFPGSPCCTWTETDVNILYLTLLLLLGGDVTQFSLGMVNCLYRHHSKFHFFGVLIADDYADMQYFCFCEVYSKSCIGLGLRAALFVLIPFHSLSCILTLHHADGGVGNSSSLSYAPSSAHVISSHSSKLIIHSH